MAKKKKSEAKPTLTFEESLGQLQEIVSQLEEGSLGLEEALGRYEQGTGLLKHCYCVLENAEQKIEQLTGFNQQGEPECEHFDATATHNQQEQKAGRRKQGAGKKKSDADEINEDSSSERNLF